MCVCVCVCVSVLQQKQFGEAVQQVNNQGIVYAEIKHEVKEWIKLAAESEEGLHQEDRRVCTAVDSQYRRS